MNNKELDNDGVLRDPDEPQVDNSEFDELTDDTITHDMIDELKAIGIPKPANVSWGKWVGPKDHSHRHDLICALAALGRTNNQIAEEIGMTAARVCIILQQQEIKTKIKTMQNNEFVNEARKRIESSLGKALDLLEEQMDNKQEASKIRQTAAIYIIDQGIGKSKQEVTHSGTVLGEFMHKLEQVTSHALDVTPKNLLAESNNPIDAFIVENVPDSVKVGKRGKEE